MIFRKKKKSIERHPEIDTIVVIGNGFDKWQGLNTSYADFQTYYYKHLDEILKKLHIKKKKCIGSDGTMEEWSDVEVIYGDPFNLDELENEFWNNFENSLADIDVERINLFFGKEKSDLKKMQRSLRNAKRILTEAFCGWIATISIQEGDAGYRFGDNCIFINFNYTDTLQKRFGVNEMREFHIHGEATDKKSIVFGHNQHPQEPEQIFATIGGRFLGLHFVDEILYETDKHCQDNIQVLCWFLAMNGVMCEKIKDRIKMPEFPFEKYHYKKGQFFLTEDVDTYINIEKMFYEDKVSIVPTEPHLIEVQYTNEQNKLFPKIKTESTQDALKKFLEAKDLDELRGNEDLKINYSIKDLGRYKRENWRFQKEWRYIISTSPMGLQEMNPPS